MEGPGTAEVDESWSPRTEARRTASRLSLLESLVRQQSTLVESLIRSVAPLRASPGGVDGSADADANALAEVAPLTLSRPAAPDTSSVRRDLEGELMAVAADSRPPTRQHDARPGAAAASALARAAFPEAYTAMTFLGTSSDAARPAQATEERADRWRILSRPGQGTSRSEERPRRLYDPDTDGNGRDVREGNNFDPATLGRHPSRQGVARVLGYGPPSDVLSSDGVSLPPPPGTLRQPAEGTALELTANDIEVFTGVLKVRKGSDGGSIIEGDPTEWLTTAVERLRGRRIHVRRWVTALMPRLAPAVRHRFRAQFGHGAGSLARTVFPFAVSPGEADVFESVAFEDFWPWLLSDYLQFAHWDAARSQWKALSSKQSTVAALAQDTFEFNRLLLKADIIEAVVTGDMARVRDPELLDTNERREAFRRMLPPAVRAQVLSVEGTRVMDASVNPAGGMVSALDSTRLSSAFPSELTLSQLQRLAVSSAAVLHRALMREEDVRVNTLQLSDGGVSEARLTALEATIQGLALDAELRSDHDAPDEVSLFNIVASHMTDAPAPEVIQARRDAKQCLACGESSSHWRFQDCPRLRSQPHLMEVLRQWLRRSQTSKPRRPDRSRPSPQAALVVSHRQPSDRSVPLAAHLHTAIVALQAMEAAMAGRQEDSGSEDS
jgi:hypothetical protein